MKQIDRVRNHRRGACGHFHTAEAGECPYCDDGSWKRTEGEEELGKEKPKEGGKWC